MKCQYCGYDLEPGNQFCTSCGKPIPVSAPPASKICPECGHENNSANLFCEKCGVPLNTASSPSPKPPGTVPAAPVQSQPNGGSSGSFQAQPIQNPVRKSRKKLWLSLSVILVLVLLVFGAGGFLLLREMGKPVPQEADQDYIALESQFYYPQPETDGAYAGEYDSLEEFHVVCTVTDQDGTIWGQNEDGYWNILASDSEVYCVEKMDIQGEETAEVTYTLLDVLKVYAVPDQDTPELGEYADLSQGVLIHSTLNQGTEVWGNVDKNKWVLLAENGTEYAAYTPPASQVQTQTTAEQNSEKKEESQEETKKEETQEEQTVDGYSPGTYTLNYNMKTRTSPSYTGKEIDVRKKGTTVNIVQLKKVSDNNSIWGELDSKGSNVWMCVKDDDYEYLTKK